MQIAQGLGADARVGLARRSPQPWPFTIGTSQKRPFGQRQVSLE